MTSYTTSTTITCLTCSGTGVDPDFHDECANCGGLGQSMTARVRTQMVGPRLCTEKQTALLAKLAADLSGLGEAQSAVDAFNRQRLHPDITAKGASTMIDFAINRCKALRAGARATAPRESLEGFWTETAGDGVAKVQRNRAGTNEYGKLLRHEEGEWVYTPGLVGQIRRGGWERLTKDRAAELGRLYGRCVACGATLTDEESIERGMGPICASKF